MTDFFQLSITLTSSDVMMVSFVTLIILWATEHFFLQASLFSMRPITRHPLFYQFCRYALNLFAAVLVVSVVPTAWLIFVLGIDLLMCLVVTAYQRYFERPISLFYALRNIREGLKIFSFATRIIPPVEWIRMMVLFLVKIGIVGLVLHRGWEPGFSVRFPAAILSASIWVGIVLALQFTSFRFSSISEASMIRLVYAYGYSISWIADLLFSPGPDELAAEARFLEKVSADRLPPGLIPHEAGKHVVMVQLESLDWNVLNFEIQGNAVTPYLNKLAAGGLALKIESFHDQGSADMDYAVLSGRIPSKRVLSYSLPETSFEDSLPSYMKLKGYRAISMHGVTGNFFNRRRCFKRMGWDEIHFREELDRDGIDCSYWGVRDREVFQHSTQRLQQATEPEFHFIITLDAHGPFNLIKEEEKTIFPKSRNWKENYFNSMAALDRNIREYVDSLPLGTLVVLYGDHTSGVHFHNFSPAKDGTKEYVPCIIHQTGSSLKPAVPKQLPDDLTILDVVNAMKKAEALNSKL